MPFVDISTSFASSGSPRIIADVHRAKEMSIPKDILKYMQEMGEVEEYKLHGREVENITLVLEYTTTTTFSAYPLRRRPMCPSRA